MVRQKSETQRLAMVMAALADPVRIEILRLVDHSGELTCSPLAEAFGVPLSTLSRHLTMLRDAGLTYSRTEGQLRWVGILYEEMETDHPGLLSAVLRQNDPLST